MHHFITLRVFDALHRNSCLYYRIRCRASSLWKQVERCSLSVHARGSDIPRRSWKCRNPRNKYVLKGNKIGKMRRPRQQRRHRDHSSLLYLAITKSFHASRFQYLLRYSLHILVVFNSVSFSVKSPNRSLISHFERKLSSLCWAMKIKCTERHTRSHTEANYIKRLQVSLCNAI